MTRRVEHAPGERFGRLTVVEATGPSGSGAGWRCRCDCGNETVVAGTALRRGLTRSCGCLRAELGVKRMSVVCPTCGGRDLKRQASADGASEG